MDGPLTEAVRNGGLCYLDEVVQARQDTIVAIHPVADHWRPLSLASLGETIDAAPSFGLVVSYNPGYQSVLKELKMSTRQRMVAIELGLRPPDIESKVITHECTIDGPVVEDLVRLGQAIPRLYDSDLREAASARALISAAILVAQGLEPREAAVAAIAGPLTNDASLTASLAMIELYVAND